MTFGETEFEHELKIGAVTRRLRIVPNSDGSKRYHVDSLTPQHLDPLRLIYDNWIDGHGQYNHANPEMYFEGEAIDTFQEGRVILGPLVTEVKESDDSDLDAAVVGFVYFKATSEWLCYTSGNIYRYNVSSNLKWTVATSTVTGVTHMMEHNGIMYAARGASVKYSYSTDGITWTQTDLTDGYANGFLVAPNSAGTSMVLWKFKTPNEVASTTDGRTVAGGGDQWTTAIYVGDTSHNIINIFLRNGILHVGKADNLYTISPDGGVHPERGDLRINQSSNNFKYVATWQTGVYHSEERGMVEITVDGGYEPMGPLTLTGTGGVSDINKVGDVKGIAGEKDFLYVAEDEGTNTVIYKGREIVKHGGLMWQWCPWIALKTNVCTTLATCQHSTTDRRLWFSYGAAGKSTAYVILSDNPTADSTYRFTTAGWLRGSYEFGTNRYWDKLFQSIILETKGCNEAGEDVVIKYRKNTDTSATACTGDITANGTTETSFSSALNAKRIQFEIHLSSNTSTATPEVLYAEIRGVEKPEVIRVHDVVYQIKSDETDEVGTLRTFLRGGGTSTSLIKLADLRFEESTATTSYVWVVMEPGYPKEVEIVHTKNQYPEIGIHCRFREVSFTVS